MGRQFSVFQFSVKNKKNLESRREISLDFEYVFDFISGFEKRNKYFFCGQGGQKFKGRPAGRPLKEIPKNWSLLKTKN